ncbi:amino acid ABC transporter permease [Erwinia endophytica]|uniref:amino acid ABC transporter permease n=1 Tax=Erwinia endophytica TaxID=1563158 RepID=UPI0012660030|nr:amino acid ABC transporter permease [Erwinia endophytica]KAB8308014.1 amino acid ABC transporter permease [Erwinia endophytica]
MLVALLVFFWKLNLDFSVIFDKLPALLGLHLTAQGGLQGAAMTLFLCAVSMSIAVVMGFVVALGRMSNNAVLFAVATFYASFFRGTPFLLQVLLIYLGLPQFGFVPAAVPAGILALSLNYGAYFSEVIRAGISAVPRSQRESALSLGLSPAQVFWLVVLPQSMPIIVPPATSLFISSLKDSSLVAVMGIWEIMFLAQSYGRSLFRYMEMLTAAAIIYWIMSLVLEVLQIAIEKRVAASNTHQPRRP